MRIHKLSSTDAFIAFDLGDAPAVGVTRLARKVLHDGAELLARSTTYSFASFGIQMGGGSAGINAEGDARDGAVAAFVDEVLPMVTDGSWATDPGLGLTPDDFAPLRDADPRPDAAKDASAVAELVARGALAAAAAVVGDLSGATLTVWGAGPVAEAVTAAAPSTGATIGDAGDVVLVAGKAGALDHEAAEGISAKAVVPLTSVPITARAHAVLTQAGCVHVPDFLSTAAPLLASYGDGGPAAAIGDAVAALAGEGTGLWMAAALAAEDFLRTWQDELPFGRPLA